MTPATLEIAPVESMPPIVVPPAVARNIVAPAAEAVVTARDAAILGAVQIRPRTLEALLEILPREPEQTPDVRRRALESALIRLRVKKRIQRYGDEWARL